MDTTPAVGVDLEKATRESVLVDAVTCMKTRALADTLLWLLNHLKWTEVRMTDWKHHAGGLIACAEIGVARDAAVFFQSGCRRSKLRGWRQVATAIVAFVAGMDALSPRKVDDLLQEAAASANHGAVHKWQTVAEWLRRDTIRAMLLSVLGELSTATLHKTVSAVTMRRLDVLPYGPGAETREERERNAASFALDSLADF